MIQYDDSAARANEILANARPVDAMEAAVLNAVDRVLNEAVAVIDEMYLPFSDDKAREKWKRWMKQKAGLIKPEPVKEKLCATRPIPCKRVDGRATRDWRVKELLAKVDEELNEMKAAIYRAVEDDAIVSREYSEQWANTEAARQIAEEAADTTTAITTALEAFGITEDIRDKAQEAVNERNKARGRL